jgi:hypothetical protein
MSYTACQYGGKYAQVDGTSYGCVVAIALMEASRVAADQEQKLKWSARLQRLRDCVQRYDTDLIGFSFDEVVVIDVGDKEEFARGLYLKRFSI